VADTPDDTRTTDRTGRGTGNVPLDRRTGGKTTASKQTGGDIQGEVYSELGKMLPVKRRNSIELDQRDVSIGRPRYAGATHITKNLAVKPNYISGGGDLMNHANVEIHLYDKGREQPMTHRYLRDWAYYPSDPNKRIATIRKGDALTPVPSDTKRFLWDPPSTTDAPGQQNILQDKRGTYLYLQEFLAGNPKTGGYYYQVLTMLDPDATSRIQVKNTIPLTPSDFQNLQKIIADPNFERGYVSKFLIDNLPGTVQSDTGIDSTIPNIVQQKKQGKAKR